jgi:hypothetical protein
MNKAAAVFITVLTAGIFFYQQAAACIELNADKNFKAHAVFSAGGHLTAGKLALHSKQKKLPKAVIKPALVFVSSEIKVKEMLSHRESDAGKTKMAVSGIYFYPGRSEMIFRQKNNLTILRARK